MNIIMITVYSTGLCLTFFFSYWLIPMANRCRFLNFFMKKDYGIIEIASKGRLISRYITDFRNELAKFRNEIYVLNPDEVYIKEGVPCIHFNERDAIDPISFKGKELTEEEFVSLPRPLQRVLLEGKKKIKVYLHPTSFEKGKPKEKYRNPEMINAVFMKQKALAEAKTLLDERRFMLLLIGGLVASAVACVLAFQVYDTINNVIIPALKGLPATPLIPVVS